MEAYLDNAATTRCLESVRDVVVKTMMEDYGNPSSRHGKGLEAEKYLRSSREAIAKTLKVGEKEIYFTSGGTESDNWAIIGAAMANRRAGRHVITTSVEHEAVLQPMEFLRERGFRVTHIPTDRRGVMDLDALRKAVCEDTILVSTMFVNNEVGAVEPVEEAAALVHGINPKILYHVDAIQAYGKFKIHPKKMGIDLLSVSGHKIHGPKGVGFLYADSKVKLLPLILGGGQQRGMRSGTDNVPGIAGLGVAAREAYANLEENRRRLFERKAQFLALVSKLPDVIVNGQPGEDGAPHIVSVSFRGVRSEVLLHALEERGVYVSSGSACSSNKKLPVSTVLKEIGLERELLDSTLRFSFSIFTTEEEVEYCVSCLEELLPMLRRYSRR